MKLRYQVQTKYLSETMPQILELLENRNLTKAKASDAMVNMYVEKKVRPA